MAKHGEAMATASAPAMVAEQPADAARAGAAQAGAGQIQAEPDFSVVVPLHNEAGNIGALVAEIVEAMGPLGRFEILCVDDGSDDETPEVLARAASAVPQLRVLQHDKRSGQSTALCSGIRQARGAWIVTMDGDGQDDPAEVANLVRRRDEAPGETPKKAWAMVISKRRKRRDSTAKRTASRLANAIRRAVLKDGVADTGTGLKLFPRALFLEFPPFDHMHRYLPALALSRGAQVLEVPVNHRPRASGRSHYGIVDRALVGIVDLFGVAWLIRRTKRPAVSETTEHESAGDKDT